MGNILSYRIGMVDKPQLPLDRVKALGVSHLEINLPPEGWDVDAIKTAVADAGLAVGSITTPCKLDDPDMVSTVTKYAEAAAALGAPILFTSIKAGDMPLEQAYGRIREFGDVAAANGVKVGMETHPDLCHNGGLAMQSMQAIDHPAVGINYDTANVYYYNEGIDTVQEIKKIAPRVVSVHLKDTMGGFHDGRFPPFGQGIVDFAGVYAVMNERGFTGPFTMELEGKLTAAGEFDAQEKIVAECVGHLKSLGLV